LSKNHQSIRAAEASFDHATIHATEYSVSGDSISERVSEHPGDFIATDGPEH
jgi:hypothetical protein